MEVHSNSIYRWIQEYEKYGERAFIGRGSHEFVCRNEITRPEKENKRLKEEVELLKNYRSLPERKRKTSIIFEFIKGHEGVQYFV